MVVIIRRSQIRRDGLHRFQIQCIRLTAVNIVHRSFGGRARPPKPGRVVDKRHSRKVAGRGDELRIDIRRRCQVCGYKSQAVNRCRLRLSLRLGNRNGHPVLIRIRCVRVIPSDRVQHFPRAKILEYIVYIIAFLV